MLKIRVVKTASNSRAVQIVYYTNRKTKIFKHVGSGSSDDDRSEERRVGKDLDPSPTPRRPPDP